MNPNPNTDSAAAIDDPFAAWLDADDQRQAAQQVQQAFITVFRQSAALEDRNADTAPELAVAMDQLQTELRNWVALGADAPAQTARLALLLSGLDQWGLAYTQAFGVAALPLLSALVGSLRTALGEQDDARFAQQYALLGDLETAALDFKIALRRAIHVALWHAMLACETLDAAQPILTQLGSLLLATTTAMPEYGWRLVADALAAIQIQCLNGDAASSGVGQQATQQLFAALDAHLEPELRGRIVALAGQVTRDWQQTLRSRAH